MDVPIRSVLHTTLFRPVSAPSATVTRSLVAGALSRNREAACVR
jgi:hypothetical protein